MASIKDIQRRIKSVKNTKKVTKAMEMVAAAKMRRAIESVLKTRTYANLSWETVLHVSKTANGEAANHKLLAKREDIKSVGMILISSNRGLCGGFNTNIINKAHKSIAKHHKNGKKVEFVVIGKKGFGVNKYYGYDVVADFPKEDIITEVKEVYNISKLVIDSYLSGKYDKVMVAYTDFVNPATQVPRIKQLLPVDMETEDEYLGVVGSDTRVGTTKEMIKEKSEKHLSDDRYDFDYTFEPSPLEVLDEMIPRLIEVQLFQALLESNASEHSARMTAMHQATDAASDMISELTLSYNKARQEKITNEIAEITAGANALESK